MFRLLSSLIGKLLSPKTEPEYEEVVEHDTVMMMIDGKLTDISEVETDDP